MNFENLFAFNPATFTGLIPFLVYLVVGLVLMKVFKFVYTAFTPYDEIALIKEQNKAAAWSYGGATVGFMIALVQALKSSGSVVDFAIWGAVALFVQCIVFFLVRSRFPKLVERINSGEEAMGIYLAFTSVAVGLLNAACMSN